jgi:hypothetical protein
MRLSAPGLKTCGDIAACLTHITRDSNAWHGTAYCCRCRAATMRGIAMRKSGFSRRRRRETVLRRSGLRNAAMGGHCSPQMPGTPRQCLCFPFGRRHQQRSSIAPDMPCQGRMHAPAQDAMLTCRCAVWRWAACGWLPAGGQPSGGPPAGEPSVRRVSAAGLCGDTPPVAGAAALRAEA